LITGRILIDCDHLPIGCTSKDTSQELTLGMVRGIQAVHTLLAPTTNCGRGTLWGHSR
jgi:hypothetical protein